MVLETLLSAAKTEEEITMKDLSEYSFDLKGYNLEEDETYIFELKSDLLGMKQHLSVLMKNMLVNEREYLEKTEKQLNLLSPTNKILNSRRELLNINEKINTLDGNEIIKNISV